MAQLTLIDLPAELQKAIIAHTPRPTDLKNFCLACKQLQSIAIPALYHTVSLDPREIGSGFLLPNNSGLQHVRKLSFTQVYPYEQSLALPKILSVLEKLPRNYLMSLETPYCMRLDANIIKLLCRSQRNIHVLSIGPSREAWFSVPEDDKDWLSHINIIDIHATVRDEEDLDFYGDLVRRSKNLQCLAIRAYGIFNLSHGFYGTLPLQEDTNEMDGAVSATVFGHLRPWQSHSTSPLVLDRLYLENQMLMYTPRNILQVIRLEVLRDLHLYSCSNPAPSCAF